MNPIAAASLRMSTGWRLSQIRALVTESKRVQRVCARVDELFAMAGWRAGVDVPAVASRREGPVRLAVASARRSKRVETRRWRRAGVRWRTELPAGARRKKWGARPTPVNAGAGRARLTDGAATGSAAGGTLVP